MDPGHDERRSKARAGSAVNGRSETYFLSDIHLGARYIADHRAHEGRVVRFLQSIESTAKSIYLLGDILDYWFEYRNVVPRGYVRFFGQLARMADSGIRITWFTGNHDIWLFDYLRDELGIRVIDAKGGGIFETIDGQLFFLGHGDDFGHQPAGYRFLRTMFHSPVLQKLYSGIHPRWTIPFAHGWSSHSRKSAPPLAVLSAKGFENIMAEARRISKENPALRYVILGHYHVALDEAVDDHCRLLILGDWIRQDTYARFDGKSLTLETYADSKA